MAAKSASKSTRKGVPPFPDTGLRIEMTLRLLLGDSPYGLASAFQHPEPRAKWIKRALRKLARHVDRLDTSVAHKELLMRDIGSALEASTATPEPTWQMVCALLSLVGHLLGFEGSDGRLGRDVSWHREAPQYYAERERLLKPEQASVNRANAMAMRRDCASRLRAEGHDTFQIALALNTSEKEVGRLLASGRRPGSAHRAASR